MPDIRQCRIFTMENESQATFVIETWRAANALKITTIHGIRPYAAGSGKFGILFDFTGDDTLVAPPLE